MSNRAFSGELIAGLIALLLALLFVFTSPGPERPHRAAVDAWWAAGDTVLDGVAP